MTDVGKRDLLKDLAVASAAVAVGLAMSGLAAADLLGHKVQLAQATPPLQSTPGAESKPSAPNTTGNGQDARPVAPEPARPDADAQKTGAVPVLPPAPAEKTAAPIPAR